MHPVILGKLRRILRSANDVVKEAVPITDSNHSAKLHPSDIAKINIEGSFTTSERLISADEQTNITE